MEIDNTSESWLLPLLLAIFDIIDYTLSKSKSVGELSQNTSELTRIISSITKAIEHLETTQATLPQKDQELVNELLARMRDLRNKFMPTTTQVLPVKQYTSRTTDPWGILETTWRLIMDYAPTEDVLIPTLCYEVSKQLHEASLPSEAIRIPSMTLRKIIVKLLREAPYSQLLQNVKVKGSTDDLTLTDEEKAAISKIVNSYLTRFKSQPNVDSYSPLILEESKMFLESFNWGGLTVEKRILQLFYNYAQQIYSKALSEKDPLIRMIYAETTKLITRLSNAFIKLERVKERLQKMKP
ncbi:MAG: hypothetical protein ACTSYN_00005 [Candidatus Heimdallarchaeaceae archaeon]